MVLTDNLIRWYKLDEVSGTTATDATGTDDGTSVNATVNQPGKIGKAYLFSDATNGYMDSDSNTGIGGADAWTQACWIKGTTGGVDAGGIMGIGSTGANTICAIMMDDYTHVGGNLWGAGNFSQEMNGTFDNTWVHIVATYDGTNIEVWEDGVSVYGPTAKSLNLGNTPFAIGRPSSYSGSYIGATIDMAGIWTRKITDAEVGELYNGGTGLDYPFAAAGTDMQLNIGDDWKDVDAAQINIGDTWKEVAGMQVNIGDVWKSLF